ncbi:MAG: protein-glutamate O-methyltransferase CheR [Pirellula sp.]
MNLSEREFNEIRQIIKGLCGVWLGDDKMYLVHTRLEPVIERFRISSYQELANRLAASANMALQDEVIEAITTNETSFNRDGYPFDEFRRSLLPNLIARRNTRQSASGLPFGKLRIWSAAASTGQEAYSLAIGVSDFVSACNGVFNGCQITTDNFSILATDISATALRIAKDGAYHERELDRGISNDQKLKYFVSQSGKFVVANEIGRLVEFRRLNLAKSFMELSGLDLIFCRNILIYFDEPTRNQVTEQLVHSLAPGGMLILGAAESLSQLPKGMIQEQFGNTIVFRRK